MKMKRTVERISTYVIIAGIGAVAGLLLAPQSGRRTRRQIKYTAEKSWKQLNDGLEKGQDLLDKGRKAVDYTARQVRRRLKLIAKAA
jgi:gas vesicle protein